MGRKNQRHVIFIKEGHKISPIDIRKGPVRSRYCRPVHEHNQPLSPFPGVCQVLIQPGHFVFHHVRIQLVQFFIIRIQCRIVDITIIKGIGQTALSFRGTVRHGKQCFIGIRFTKFPIQRIGFMVPKNRGNGHIGRKDIGIFIPGFPLIPGLSIIAQISYDRKKGGSGMGFIGSLCRLSPDTIIS